MIKSRKQRTAGHLARMEEGRSAFKILKSKPSGKIPLGRPRNRWEVMAYTLETVAEWRVEKAAKLKT